MSDFKAPCRLCGYNGPGFYQPISHPCASHGTLIDATFAELDAARRVVEVTRKWFGRFAHVHNQPIHVCAHCVFDKETHDALRDYDDAVKG
jgi:hypothetical protein